MVENRNISYVDYPVSSSPVKSLFKTLELVKSQVDYKDFIKSFPTGKKYADDIINEICLVIAEMYVKPPESVVRIRGELVQAGIVQEVYRALQHDHIEYVAEKLKGYYNTICKKTPYLQTALYNVFFEYSPDFGII